jgi:hypothetical protein
VIQIPSMLVQLDDEALRGSQRTQRRAKNMTYANNRFRTWRHPPREKCITIKVISIGAIDKTDLVIRKLIARSVVFPHFPHERIVAQVRMQRECHLTRQPSIAGALIAHWPSPCG